MSLKALTMASLAWLMVQSFMVPAYLPRLSACSQEQRAGLVDAGVEGNSLIQGVLHLLYEAQMLQQGEGIRLARRVDKWASRGCKKGKQKRQATLTPKNMQ